MYKQKKLSNGLRVVTAPVKGTKTVTVLAMIATGSKYENRNNNGISHFLEHMFFKGTKNRPHTLDIAEELDSVGAEYNAFTDKECTGYWIKTSGEQKELALDVVSDILMNSKFSGEEIERERGVIMEERNMYHNNPMMRIDDLFEQCLYGDTPAGWEIVGTKKNIQNLKRSDFIDYFKSQYGAENTVLCLAGNISERDSEKLAAKYFQKLRKAKPRNKAGVKDDKQKGAKIKTEYKKGEQVNLSLGVRTYPIGDPREYALEILS